ncbi:MAG TPA: phytoene desaturase family protein, partial [Flavobacteriales bacterium]|nr:phytoene desaturase family protein [Flavobacteriales bacterium]
HEVSLLEKNGSTGGRCRSFMHEGFTFDMGPSWYWMPDVFERYFNLFGKSANDYYSLKRLDPSYRVFFDHGVRMDVPANLEGIYALFEEHEKGSSSKLKKFLASAGYKYNKSMKELVFKPGRSWVEFMQWSVISSVFKIHLFSPIAREIRKNFKTPHLQQLLEFPVLFLGARPENTPALYSLMNYADMVLGTWYPLGGMCKITEAMTKLACEKGVTVELNCAIQSFTIDRAKIESIHSETRTFISDGVIAAADYHHVEKTLLNGKANYTDAYWDTRKLAPSCLIFYVGVSKRIKNLLHHNLFFDADFNRHAAAIYDKPEWPEHPLFYVCTPSVTDPAVAPPGCENLFILIPVSTAIDESDEIKERYFNLVIDRIEKQTGEHFKADILFKKSFAKKEFISAYNAYKGNAYGLANTLRQTAVLKPKIYNKKIHNLFYAGQLTVPGPGVPPALISGEIAASQLMNY